MTDRWSREIDYNYYDPVGLDKLTVCVTHKRFVPCRSKDGCTFSTEDEDVEMVRAYQSGV